MADIRTWTPESDVLKPGEISGVQEIRSWFERLPRMRALIRQQQEHIESLRSAATTTTSSNSGAPATPAPVTKLAPTAMQPWTRKQNWPN